MRILHVTYSLAADQGGPTMVTTRVAAAQAGLGHEVTILTRASAGKETEIPAIAGSERVKIERVAPSSALARVLGSDSLPRLRELIARHDVVHVHNIWDPIMVHAVNEARRQKKPVVLSPHGILTRWALSEKRLKKAIAMRLLYRRAIMKVSVVHALSTFEREEIAAFGFKGPVAVVPNGVFLEEIDPLPARGAFFAAHPELNGEPYVLFLSRLHPIKGLDILVDAFARVLTALGAPGPTPSSSPMPEAHAPGLRSGVLPHLAIVGPDFGMEGPIRAQAARLNISDRVHLMGPIFGREKYEAMVDCACFCLPSGHEAFSVAIAEAMACRAAVVISPECHLPEAATAGAGFVVERDAVKLASALERTLVDEHGRVAMGEAGRKLVVDHFTWAKVAEALIEAYRGAEAR